MLSIRAKNRVITLSLLLCLVCPRVVLSAVTIDDVPIVGGAYDLSKVIQQEVMANIEMASEATIDTALFTIGGLTLDAYILTLPLEANVKASVISRISNPFYAITLGRFLYQFKGRYSDADTVTPFSDFIKKHYQENEVPGLRHSLFSWAKEIREASNSHKKTSSQEQPSTQEKSNDQENNFELDRELIATFVTIYDALNGVESLILKDKPEDEYQYLSNRSQDLALVNKVQPLIIAILKRLRSGMAAGDIADALDVIIRDEDPTRQGMTNNKAQAITVTLIDFIRLNVLKSYRQYRLENARVVAFEKWMRHLFRQDPHKLLSFLEAQNKKRHVVQITVDGLQGEYLKSLAQQGQQQFLQQVKKNTLEREAFRPKSEKVSSPETDPQMHYLKALGENKELIANDPRHLPFFKQLYQDYSKSISIGGISSTPTISVRNLPLIWTGASVAGESDEGNSGEGNSGEGNSGEGNSGEGKSDEGKSGTGVPNFHFVDRQQDRAYYFFGNDALQLDRLLAERQVKTMFDRFNHLKTLNCNAQYDWNAHVSFDGLVNLAVGEAVRDFGEMLCIKELRYRAKIEQQLKADREALIHELKVYESMSKWRLFSRLSKRSRIKDLISNLAETGENGMPDYLLVYNPWPDHFAHFKGPFSDEIMSPSGELNRLDYWLGQINETYQQAGIYDTTLWGMAGDHGLAPIFYYLNPETQVLASLSSELQEKNGVSLVVKKISSDEGEGPKITNALNYPSNKDIDVVVASTAGGNFMLDFFIDQEKRWHQQALYTDMVSWKPIGFSHEESGIDMVSEISARLSETLDYLVIREADCSLDRCDIRLVGYREGIRHDEFISRVGDRIQYHAGEHEPILLDLQKINPYRDALSLEAQKLKAKLYQRCVIQPKQGESNSWCLDKDWRRLSYFTPRPDSVNQLAHLYDEERAGTINLFPKEGIGYNTKVPGRHAGEHFHEKDAFIGFWGAPVNVHMQLQPIANGSLAPTLYEYLSGDTLKNGDGWGFPSVLEFILQ